MVTCEIDTNRLFLALDAQREALIGRDMDATTVVLSNTKALARTLTNVTPPIREKGNKGSPKLNGEDAIKRELCSLFSEAQPRTIDEVGSLHGIKHVNAWLTGRDGAKMNIQWDNIDPEASRMKEYHNKYRTKQGTVYITRRQTAPNIWKARVVVPQGSRAPYIKAVQSRVGRAKCSMGLIGMRLGEDYPGWIARHKGSVSDIGVVNINMANPAFPSVLFGSRAPGILRIRDRAQAAVKIRVRAIHRHIKLILADYKDWETVRAKARSRRRSSQPPGETKENVE